MRVISIMGTGGKTTLSSALALVNQLDAVAPHIRTAWRVLA